MPSTELEELARELLLRLDPLLPPREANDWSARAYAWRRRRYFGVEVGTLQPISRVASIGADDLFGIEEQKQALLRNTEQFVRGLPANNVLLTGARGTGKSSLVRACLDRYGGRGLRLVEVDRAELADLPEIAARVAARPERFIVFCDDLSFEATDASYKALKAALDGSLAAGADNLLIYATSNRRHLMPEFMRENLESRYDGDGELHPGETAEEKISLSERFGLWLSFHPFRQDDYLAIVEHWLRRLGVEAAAWPQSRPEALRFALGRGSRSGRVAQQFARDFAGRLGLPAAGRE